ncbi:hypothetical protein B0H14DRAFT_2656902 [Mycena olivaceomarginata]|nr:hypothetical protein B0H14DRAFT_2656902 [Mycena olivaceomarginata]
MSSAAIFRPPALRFGSLGSPCTIRSSNFSRTRFWSQIRFDSCTPWLRVSDPQARVYVLASHHNDPAPARLIPQEHFQHVWPALARPEFVPTHWQVVNLPPVLFHSLRRRVARITHDYVLDIPTTRRKESLYGPLFAPIRRTAPHRLDNSSDVASTFGSTFISPAINTCQTRQDSAPPVFLGKALDRTWVDLTELKVGAGIVQLNVVQRSSANLVWPFIHVRDVRLLYSTARIASDPRERIGSRFDESNRTWTFQSSQFNSTSYKTFPKLIQWRLLSAFHGLFSESALVLGPWPAPDQRLEVGPHALLLADVCYTGIAREESCARTKCCMQAVSSRLFLASSQYHTLHPFPSIAAMTSSQALIPWEPVSNNEIVTIQENSHPEGRRWALILNAFLSPSPGRTLDQVYTAAGKVLETQANHFAYKLGLGPHVIAGKIKYYFGNGEHRMQQLELIRTTIPPKLKKQCLKLMKYSLPTESANTQCQAFKEVVDLVTLLPGLRVLFLQTKILYSATSLDTISALWDRFTDPPDKEWTFWQALAATCLADTVISAMTQRRVHLQTWWPAMTRA